MKVFNQKLTLWGDCSTKKTQPMAALRTERIYRF